jgi:hypothetical protein
VSDSGMNTWAASARQACVRDVGSLRCPGLAWTGQLPPDRARHERHRDLHRRCSRRHLHMHMNMNCRPVQDARPGAPGPRPGSATRRRPCRAGRSPMKGRPRIDRRRPRLHRFPNRSRPARSTCSTQTPPRFRSVVADAHGDSRRASPAGCSRQGTGTATGAGTAPVHAGVLRVRCGRSGFRTMPTPALALDDRLRHS